MAKENKEALCLAIQGSGRNARIAACDSTGSLLMDVVLGPLTPRVNRDFRHDCRLIAETFASELGFPSVTSLVQRVGGLCVAMSGVCHDREIFGIRQTLIEVGLVGNFEPVVCEDVWADLAASGSDTGVVAVAGTGANIFVRNIDRESHKVGGWGSGISDWGSGFNVGMSAVQLCVDQFDRRRSASPAFVEAILDSLRLKHLSQLIVWYHALQQTSYWRCKIADIAIPVCRLAEADEEHCAMDILSKSADGFILSIRAALRGAMETVEFPVNEPIPFVVSGGLALSSVTYLNAIKTELAECRPNWPAMELQRARFHPIVGALAFAYRQRPALPSASFMKSLTANVLGNPTFEF
ncbi:MAG: hypothetical protein MPJ50_15425 [Pirellulales bacterium]|nr:hypothetical protein [Pirellulales bacterium]